MPGAETRVGGCDGVDGAVERLVGAQTPWHVLEERAEVPA